MRRVNFILVLLMAQFAYSQPPVTEVFSPLGRAFSSMPDEQREVEKADKALFHGPENADLLLAAARARDNLYRFSESIPLYTRGMDEYPNDVRFPRFRGHRFISTRRFDAAIVDLKRAAELAPASFDVSYHLALAYYLRGDFNHAVREYQHCLAMSALPRPGFMKGLPAGWRSCFTLDDDSRVAISVWAWSALRRAGKTEEAARLLHGVSGEMDVKENKTYQRMLLLYKGGSSENQTMSAAMDSNAGATAAYGIGLWHWVESRKDQACAYWERAMADRNWTTFGFIAAEAEIARGACKPVGKR